MFLLDVGAQPKAETNSSGYTWKCEVSAHSMQCCNEILAQGLLSKHQSRLGHTTEAPIVCSKRLQNIRPKRRGSHQDASPVELDRSGFPCSPMPNSAAVESGEGQLKWSGCDALLPPSGKNCKHAVKKNAASLMQRDSLQPDRLLPLPALRRNCIGVGVKGNPVQQCLTGLVHF